LRGTVVFTHGALKEIRLEHTQDGTGIIYAEAGVASPKVARFAATHGLHKAEFMAGIPGTVGGTLAMNAGCYGSETWDIVEAVLCLRRDGTFVRRTRSGYDIAYRHVELRKGENGGGVRADGAGKGVETFQTPRRSPELEDVFVAAWFKLEAGDADASRRVIKELLQRRIATQPLDQPNAGSVFRNPPGEYAARLIEACGLKGFSIGGAQVSIKHANFIINTGEARAADIETLLETVQQAVWDKHAVMLEREVRIIGEPE
jgi:UDP-N-acetylmuramate dehydrogenase